MSQYRKVPTSREVWAAIKARHIADLVVFSSFSAPDGNHFFGNPEEAVIETDYGLRGADIPLMGARTTWSVGEPINGRKDEHTDYWLYVATRDAE